MNDDRRLVWQLVANIGGVGFVIFMAFTQLADFLTERKPRHLVAALAWFVLFPILVLRTAAIPDPPLLDQQFIADRAAIGWATTLLLAMVWAIWLWFEKRHAAKLRKELGLEPGTERGYEDESF